MNTGPVLAGAVATALLFAASGPSLAQFTCDAGDLAGDCTISAPQAVGGDTTVAGNLTITASGELNYGSGTATITVGGDLTVDGLISADGSAGASGAAGAGGNPGAAGDPGLNGTNGGDLTIDVAGSATVSTDGSISVIGGAGGDGGVGGNSGGNNTGGAGGMGGTGGDGGSVTLNVCGDVDVEGAATGLITADGGDGGDGGAGGTGGSGNPGNGGDGGDGGDNGSGGTVEINADGTITIDGDVSALEGNVGSGGAAGIDGGHPNGVDGSPGGPGSDVGSDGSITLSTAKPAVLGTGLPTTPAATENDDQEPICAAVLDVTKELIESNGLDDFSVALAFGQIGVGLEEIQTFVYKITVTRRAVLGGEGEATEGVVIFDKVPAEYNLLCDAGGPTACEVEDLMGVLDTDALAVEGECMVAVRRPDSAYKLDPPPKQPEIIIIEVGDLTESDDMCMVTVAVITDQNPGNHEPPLFEPTGCLPATDKNGVLIRDDSQDIIVDWILLNEGLEGYDPVDGGLLFGPVAGLKLEPVGCPAPADADGDDIPDVLDVCPDIPAGFVAGALDSDDDGTADFEDGELCTAP